MLLLNNMMIKLRTYTITLFFILSFAGFIYADSVDNGQTNLYKIVKNIPSSFGKVFETNINNEENPDIIIINDIHSQSFAQKNIYSIIKHIKSEIDIDKILVEGASKGKVNSSAITDIDKNTREKLLNKMLNEGLVSGTEYFCYITNTELYGIEDSVTYMETLKQAYMLIRNENFFSIRLEKAKKDLKKLKKRFYSKDMSDFEYLFFNRTNIEPEKHCKLLLNIIDTYSIDINKYSEIHNFINITNCNIKLEPYQKNFSKDFDYLVQKMKNYAPFNVYEKFIKDCKTKNIEENLIISYKFVNKFLSQKENEYFSYIDILEQKYNLVRIFNINKYLDEEENFYNETLDKIFQTKQQKDIAFINQMIFLTEKYTKLNIDFYSFDNFSKNKNKFIETLNNTDFIKNKDELIEILNNEELSNYYNNNIKRDSIFFNNITELIEEGTTNILVIGGFHKTLLDLFNENGKKYIVIFPNANGNDNNIYKQLILDIGSYNFTTK